MSSRAANLPMRVLPLPICIRCRKQVDRVDVDTPHTHYAFRYTAHCHGETEACLVGVDDAERAEFTQGVAFADGYCIEDVRETVHAVLQRDLPRLEAPDAD